ncbi:MAG: sensor histidine kinase [Bacteroidota bacterium]
MSRFFLVIFLYPLLTTAHEFPVVENGIINLSHHELDNDFLDLVGNWKFYSNEFIDPSEIKQDLSEWIEVTSPDVWKGYTWKDKPLSGIGFGTYYLRIELPEDAKELGLKIPTIGTAGRVFVNGKEVAHIGKVGKSKEGSVPRFERPLVYLKAPFDQNILEIIVHVSNFDYRKGGLWNAFTLGEWDLMLEKNRRDLLLESFLMGAIVIMGLYHLMLFILGRKGRYNLFFALICLLSLTRSLVTGEVYIVNLFPGIPWSLHLKLELITLFLVGPLNIIFVQALYPRQVSDFFVKLVSGIGLVATLIVIFVSVKTASYFVIPFQFIILLQALYFIYVIIRAVKQKLGGARVLLFSLIVVLLAFINDIMMVNYVYHTFAMVQIAVFIYIFSLSYIGARRFNLALNSVEQLSSQLGSVNKSLEEKVNKRTLKLKESNDLINEQNKQISEQNSELKRLNAEQGNLMAVVAHDLKSPLNRILGLLEILKLEGKLKKEQENITNQIENIANSGKKLISDLTSLQSFELKDDEVVFEEVDLIKYMSDLSSEYKAQANLKGIELGLEIPDTPIEIYTVPDLLRRITDNLVSNALKFSKPNTKVQISIFINDPGYWVLSVKDQGPGFTEEDQRKLFRKFQKLSAQPTSGESSTGLGLAIVKSLTEKLKGDIFLESISGVGSEFKLKFPQNPSDMVSLPHDDGV